VALPGGARVEGAAQALECVQVLVEALFDVGGAYLQLVGHVGGKGHDLGLGLGEGGGRASLECFETGDDFALGGIGGVGEGGEAAGCGVVDNVVLGAGGVAVDDAGEGTEVVGGVFLAVEDG